MCVTRRRIRQIPCEFVTFAFALLLLAGGAACQEIGDPAQNQGSGGSAGVTGGDGSGGSGPIVGTGGGSSGPGGRGTGGTPVTTGSGGSTGGGSGGSPGGSGGSRGSGGAVATGTGGSSGGCVGGLMRCGTACVDITGSQTNCGACGRTCRTDQTCWQSACTCATGQADCGGVCKDVTTSAVNCGMCNNMCATGATCVGGMCQCPTDQSPCAGACTPLGSDPRNCGMCGVTCGSGTMCLFGACLDPNSLACSPSAQANRMSARDATIPLGKYWINNNWWGAGTGSGTQSIWSTCQQGDLIGWGTSYNWTGTSNAVKSYASAVLGWHWGWKVTNSGLPVQISAGRRINCGWDFTLTHSGGSANATYDVWAHTQAMPGTNDDPSDEIMIWLYAANGAGPIGTRQATARVGGVDWYLHRGAITDASGRHRWNVFSYLRTANATTSVVNIMDFMNDLVTRTWMQSSKYVTSVQAGSEIFTGTGQLDTRGYYCRVQ